VVQIAKNGVISPGILSAKNHDILEIWENSGKN